MRKRSLRGVNEHFDPIFNAVLPSAGTFQTSPNRCNGVWRRQRRGKRGSRRNHFFVCGNNRHETSDDAGAGTGQGDTIEPTR
ncbi:hypothetical protein EBB56_02360 [Halomonas sp. YLB-10]|nr:hypothetical protein EBB56_02360 [Halomonas sp. YLB-10]